MKNKVTKLGVVLMVFGGVFLLFDAVMNGRKEMGGMGWLIDYILLFSGGVIFIMSDWRT